MAGIGYAEWKDGNKDSGQQKEPPVVLCTNTVFLTRSHKVLALSGIGKGERKEKKICTQPRYSSIRDLWREASTLPVSETYIGNGFF